MQFLGQLLGGKTGWWLMAACTAKGLAWLALWAGVGGSVAQADGLLGSLARFLEPSS